MLRPAWAVCMLIVCGLSLIAGAPVRAADAEIDSLLRSPIGKDWVTNGGNLTNNRYSTLKQIDTTNVGKLKGAWMTRLKGSGVGGKYSFEASPLVKDGILYVVTGNDDVFALNAKSGEILWEGVPLHAQNVRDTERAGIVIIHQELMLVPQLSVSVSVIGSILALRHDQASRGQ